MTRPGPPARAAGPRHPAPLAAARAPGAAGGVSVSRPSQKPYTQNPCPVPTCAAPAGRICVRPGGNGWYAAGHADRRRLINPAIRPGRPTGPRPTDEGARLAYRDALRTLNSALDELAAAPRLRRDRRPPEHSAADILRAARYIRKAARRLTEDTNDA